MLSGATKSKDDNRKRRISGIQDALPVRASVLRFRVYLSAQEGEFPLRGAAPHVRS